MFTKTVMALSAAIALSAASMTPAVSAGTKARATAAKQSHAQAVPTQQGRRFSSNPRNDVYRGGFYVGSDPDPLVRLYFLRNNDD